jgi:hypothetical protein
MAIPEAQLDTWSHQGAVAQSKDTYATVKRALEAASAKYAGKNYEIFLQGSYCNDTNIFAESDVDVVIRLNATYHYELAALNAQERATFQDAFVPATYHYADFKGHVIDALQASFGNDVSPGPNAIKISANGNRRNSDVLVATDFRCYSGFAPLTKGQYPHGICFFNGDGKQVVNYPKLHSANCSAKHQATNSWFKPTVRILKNLRGRLEADGLIPDGCAPSYYLEGLMYNVPNEKFGGCYQDTMVETINWILAADRSKFWCANRQTNLLGASAVTWPPANCDLFLDAVKKLWKEWS